MHEFTLQTRNNNYFSKADEKVKGFNEMIYNNYSIGFILDFLRAESME